MHAPPDPEEFRHLLADRIRAARLWRNLTQEDLAHRAGVAVRTVVSIESGRHGSSTDVIYALARAMDMSVAELVADE
ncbi:helix-turn-helix transcriptional regulator [Streptomyces sp. NPDC059631]|uniref:helix-turn-helix transcriptional regulator n=1 Tax=unclassified Streptomyces TaxID=2593676 RepID=UPI0036BDB42A